MHFNTTTFHYLYLLVVAVGNVCEVNACKTSAQQTTKSIFVFKITCLVCQKKIKKSLKNV